MRFYLQLRDGTDKRLDAEGTDFPDMGAFVTGVLANARDMISSDASSEVIDLRQRIDAEDEAGNIIHSLAFTDAIKIEQ